MKTITLPIEVLSICKPEDGDKIYVISVRLGEQGGKDEYGYDRFQILAERGDPIGNFQLVTERETYELADVNLADYGIVLD